MQRTHTADDEMGHLKRDGNADNEQNLEMKVQHCQRGGVGRKLFPELEVDGDAEDRKEHEDDGHHDDFVRHNSAVIKRRCLSEVKWNDAAHQIATHVLGTYRRVMPLRMRFARERFASTPVIYKVNERRRCQWRFRGLQVGFKGGFQRWMGSKTGRTGPRQPHLVGRADNRLTLVVQVDHDLLTNSLCA